MYDRGGLVSCTPEAWTKIKKRLEGPNCQGYAEDVWSMSDARFREVFQYDGSTNHVPLYFTSEKGNRQLRTTRVRTGYANNSRASVWAILLARYRGIPSNKMAMKSICGDINCFNPWCASRFAGQLSKRKKEDMMEDRRMAKRRKEEDELSLKMKTVTTPGQDSDGYSSASFLSEPTVSCCETPDVSEFFEPSEFSAAADSECSEAEESSQEEPICLKHVEEPPPRFDPTFYHNGKLILGKLAENDPLFHELLAET